jgi:hypothetical protein
MRKQISQSKFTQNTEGPFCASLIDGQLIVRKKAPQYFGKFYFKNLTYNNLKTDI